MKRKLFARTFSVILVAVVLTLSLPITAFAADEVEPRYTIIHTPDGGTISTDPAVKKVDDIPNYLFEDPLGGSRAMMERMERSSVTPEDKGSYTVMEHTPFQIQTPTEAAGSVTWSTSSSYHCSVNSSGYVQTTTAGAFYVYASFIDSYGASRLFRYSILIEVGNGVYTFKNKSTNLYIELPGGSITNGTQYAQISNSTNRNSKFKITKVGTGLYSIRSMVASSMGFKKSGSYLVNSEIGTSNSVSSDAKWLIASNANGYYIYNGSTAYTLKAASSSGNITITYYGGYTDQLWSLSLQTANENGVEIRNTPLSLLPGESVQLKAIVYSSYADENGQNSIQWQVTNGTGSATVSSTGLVTASSYGNVLVRAIYRRGSSEVWIASWTLRICLPLSGYELDYDPSLWSGVVEEETNCYAYAINNQLCADGSLFYDKQQPGEYKPGGTLLYDYHYANNTPYFTNAVEEDFEDFGDDFGREMVFTYIGSSEVCPAGTYKVALFFDPYVDYHWYRQNSDGTWSHKPGTNPITRLDDSSNLIYDPQEANTGSYTQFGGYFAVTPWNRYYNASSASISKTYAVACADTTAMVDVFLSDIDKLTLGMSYDDVTQILGKAGVDVGSGAILYEYKTENGESIILNFARNSSNTLILMNIIY